MFPFQFWSSVLRSTGSVKRFMQMNARAVVLFTFAVNIYIYTTSSRSKKLVMRLAAQFLQPSVLPATMPWNCVAIFYTFFSVTAPLLLFRFCRRPLCEFSDVLFCAVKKNGKETRERNAGISEQATIVCHLKKAGGA